MLSRIKILLFLPLLLLCRPSLHAQELKENDYLRHNKVFYLCAFERECSGCYECGKQRYWVEIKNRSDKKIKKVSYVFYSDVFNKVLTKEAKLDAAFIDPNSVGKLFVCVPNGKHWAITEIVYNDDTKVNFVVYDRLDKFDQEPDECDCNKITSYPNPNMK